MCGTANVLRRLQLLSLCASSGERMSEWVSVRVCERECDSMSEGISGGMIDEYYFIIVTYSFIT